jgi:hypothetical protein
MDKLDPPCGSALLPEPKPRFRPVKQFPDPMNPAHVFTECRRQARKKVKEALQREGRKLIEVDAAELQRLAQAYFEGHRSELVELVRKRLSER